MILGEVYQYHTKIKFNGFYFRSGSNLVLGIIGLCTDTIDVNDILPSGFSPTDVILLSSHYNIIYDTIKMTYKVKSWANE